MANVVLNRDEKTGKLSYAPNADVGVAAESNTGGLVPMVDAEGNPQMVTSGDVGLARSKGWRDSSVAEVSDLKKEQRFQEHYGSNEIEAFAEGALRGGTFGLSDYLLQGLGVSDERLREVQRRNAISAVVGEVGGAIGTAFVPGSLGAGVAKVGAGVEDAITGARVVDAMSKGGRVARAVARYAPTVMRAAVEGGAYGVGGGISQTALSEDPFSAEALVGNMASGAFTGATTGAALGLGAKFLGDAATAASRYRRGLQADTIADDVIGAHLTEAEPAGVRAVEAEGAPRTRNVPDEVVEDFKSKYHRQDTISRQQVRQIESMEKRGLEVSDELRAAADDLEAARRQVRSFLPVEKERSYESFLSSGDELGGSYARGQGKSMQTWTGDNKAIAAAVVKPGFRDALVEHQAQVDRVQSLLGNKAYPPVVGDHPVFQPFGFADEQRPAIEEFLNAPSARKSAAQVGRKRLDQSKVEGLFGVEAPTGAKITPGDLTKPTLAERAKGAVGEVAEGGLKAAAKTAVKKFGGALLGMHAGRGHGKPWLGALLGHHLLGGLASHAADYAAKGMTKLADGVDRIVTSEPARKAVAKTARAIFGGTSFAVAGHRPDPEAKTEYQKRASEMATIAGNPMVARRSIHDSLEGVRTLDAVLADQMEEVAFRRLMYLADRMPKAPDVGPQLGKHTQYRPTDAEQAKWARCVQAVEDPASVLDMIADGTVTKEHVEALEAVYPEMYGRIQADLAGRAVELRTEIPWERRRTLSVLFHVPADAIMQPQKVAAMQEAYAIEEQEQPPPPKMSAAKPPEPTKAQRMAG